MRQNLAYYTTHSPITDPGPYAYLYDDLPDDLEQLFKIINGVLFHKSDAEDRYGPTSVQRKEQFLRTMEQRLARIVALDPSPLTVPREMKERQIACCRDYAVLMTSILRHKGRAGFKPGLDFTDIRRNDEFHLAPHAWLQCRSGEANSELFRHNAHWRGWGGKDCGRPARVRYGPLDRHDGWSGRG
jgi:hypothetical protein